MQTSLETLGQLERRLNVAVPLSAIESEVAKRLIRSAMKREQMYEDTIYISWVENKSVWISAWEDVAGDMPVGARVRARHSAVGRFALCCTPAL